nr:hypothetical protein [Tanacetum cinerariifolium]
KNMIAYLKNTEGFKMAFFKGKTYDQIHPIFQARFDANMRFLLKSKEEMEKEEEAIIKSINETPAQKLEVVVDEDDDVLIEATPIGRKVEEESEMSLELLRFTRQQLLEQQQE